MARAIVRVVSLYFYLQVRHRTWGPIEEELYKSAMFTVRMHVTCQLEYFLHLLSPITERLNKKSAKCESDSRAEGSVFFFVVVFYQQLAGIKQHGIYIFCIVLNVLLHKALLQRHLCDVRLRSAALCSVEIEQAPKCPQWCKQYDSHSLFNVPTRVGCINTRYLPRAHNGKIKIS